MYDTEKSNLAIEKYSCFILFFLNVLVPFLHGMELSQIEQGLVPGIHVFFMP